MASSKAKKAAELKELQDFLSTNDVLVVAENRGLTVKQVSDLRRAARAEGAAYKVSKNSLAKLAVKGTIFEALADLFKGPTGIIVSKDAVSAAKIAQKFAKDSVDKFVIMGGAMGETRMDAKQVVQLASLPSLDQLRGKLIGLIQAPATKVAGVLQAPAGQLARVVAAYSKKEA